jgi:hypothetical protein
MFLTCPANSYAAGQHSSSICYSCDPAPTPPDLGVASKHTLTCIVETQKHALRRAAPAAARVLPRLLVLLLLLHLLAHLFASNHTHESRLALISYEQQKRVSSAEARLCGNLDMFGQICSLLC